MERTALNNIRTLYGVKALSWFYMAIAFIYPYYASVGLSLADYFLLQSIFALAVVIFEFPTGYIGDRFGHHRSIQVGLFCSTVGWAIMCVFSTFGMFALAEVCMALGAALVSGSDSALLYDSTQAAGVDYKQAENRTQSVTSFSEAFGALAGSAVVMYGVATVVIVHTSILALAAVLALQLSPVRTYKKSKLSALQDMLATARYAYTHAYVRNLLWFSGIISTLTISGAWFLQPYLTLAGVPVWLFGIAWFVQNASRGVVSLWIGNIESWLGDAMSVVCIVCMPLVALLALGIAPVTYASAGLFLLFVLTRSLLQSYAPASLQHHALDDRRASIMSLQGLVFRLCFAIITPAIAYVSTAYSLYAASVFLCMVAAVGIAYPARYLYRDARGKRCIDTTANTSYS